MEFQWTINQKAPSFAGEGRVTIGFTMNPDTFTSIVDKGPLADSQEVSASNTFHVCDTVARHNNVVLGRSKSDILFAWVAGERVSVLLG